MKEALTSFDLMALVAEWQGLVGGYVDKVYQAKDEVTLRINVAGDEPARPRPGGVPHGGPGREGAGREGPRLPPEPRRDVRGGAVPPGGGCEGRGGRLPDGRGPRRALHRPEQCGGRRGAGAEA